MNDWFATRRERALRCFHSHRSKLLPQKLESSRHMTESITHVRTHLTSPMLLKRRGVWDGLRLEHYLFERGELPEHRHAEHTVLISLSDGCPAAMRTGSGLRIVGTQK